LKTISSKAPEPQEAPKGAEELVLLSHAEIYETIDRWFDTAFLNTELGHHTNLWVLVRDRKEDLKQRLVRTHKES
jgi:hypothetical protein